MRSVRGFGAGPWEVQSPPGLGQSVSRGWNSAVLGAGHRGDRAFRSPSGPRHCPRCPARPRPWPRETSGGHLSTGRAGHASCLEKSLCGLSVVMGSPPPPTDEIFTVFSSQGRAPSLDEGLVYWAGACTGPSSPAESGPRVLRVPSIQDSRPLLIPPARGFACPAECREWVLLGQTPQAAVPWPHVPPHLCTFGEGWSP